MTLFLIIFISAFSSQLTHFIVKRYHWTSVRTSALTSLVFALIMQSFHIPSAETLSATFLGASFLGMANSEIFSERDLFFGSMIFALIFYFVLPFNIGLGGALGTAAFISCAIIRGCYLVVNKLFHKQIQK